LSRIHEALRRGVESSKHAGVASGSAHADTVLATLGYPSESPRRNLQRLILLLFVVGLAAVLYVSWPWLPARSVATARSGGSPAVASTPGSAGHPAPTPASRLAPPAAAPSSTSAEAPKTATASAPASSTRPQVPPQVVDGNHSVPSRTNVSFDAPRSSASNPRGAPIAASSTRGHASATNSDDFQRAVYYQRAGEFDQSLVHYKAVLQRDELNVEAHNNLGLLYRDKGLTDEAVREFDRALFIAPRYVRARNNLGVMLLELGRIDAAAAEFRAALAVDPRNIDAMVNLALAEKSAGETVDARGSLVRALTIDPHSAAAHYNLGLQYEEVGEAARAVEHYRAFLRYAGPEYAGRAPDVRARIAALESQIK
jgi:Tfp pilus assembly protein PilF